MCVCVCTHICMPALQAVEALARSGVGALTLVDLDEVVCMYACVCICMYVYACMYMHPCICMYVHVCVCMYVCTCTHQGGANEGPVLRRRGRSPRPLCSPQISRFRQKAQKVVAALACAATGRLSHMRACPRACACMYVCMYVYVRMYVCSVCIYLHSSNSMRHSACRLEYLYMLFVYYTR